jgi:hypothetical protein
MCYFVFVYVMATGSQMGRTLANITVIPVKNVCRWKYTMDMEKIHFLYGGSLRRPETRNSMLQGPS